MGQQIAQSTATGVEQAVSASYAQTEIYFMQRSLLSLQGQSSLLQSILLSQIVEQLL